MERDAASALAEYGAQFRVDVESFVSREAIDACTSPGVFERAALDALRYTGFIDPSGGSADSMTMAVGHLEGDRAVLDCLRERRPPFAPTDVVAEFSETLKLYRVSEVHGDRYAGEWPREAFRKHGVEYQPAAKPKSDLYLSLLPRLNSGQIDLLDHPRLIAQLAGLERKTARGGRESIDHGPGGHDDLSNVLAGVVAELSQPARRVDGFAAPEIISGWRDQPVSEPVGRWWM
jgi:hypothetical protein